MKKISLAALAAAMMLPGLAMAQDVSISTSASTEVSVSAPDTSSLLSSAVSDVSSAVSSAVSDTSSDLSSTISEVSSDVSSAVSSVSSELSSEMASSSMSSGMDMSCDDLDASTMMLTAVDSAMLAAVTSVTVFAVDECTGLGDLAAIDGGAVATLQTNQMVIDALAAQGEAGAEIVAYSFDGASLTVYVRART